MRTIYGAALPIIACRPVEAPADLPFAVYAYSGESMLPEQVASIRSFLRYAGRPKKFTVVSDGTYSPRGIALLRSIDSVVSVSSFADWLPPNLSPRLHPYFTEHPTGKQLALIMSLPIDGPALYVDSDILFFSGARILSSLSPIPGVPAQYLADCQLSADDRLFRNPSERRNPVNTGVLFLSGKLDWSLGLDRLSALEGAPNFFTNQTISPHDARERRAAFRCPKIRPPAE